MISKWGTPDFRQLKLYTNENVFPQLTMGVREFLFFMFGGTRAEKGWEPLIYRIHMVI